MDYEITKSESTAALRRILFFFPSSADGYTPVTGKIDADFTCRISKNGASAIHAGTFTEIDAANMPGMYYYEATAGEVDTAGWLLLVISATASVTQRVVVRVGLSNTGIDSQLSADILATEGFLSAEHDDIKGAGFSTSLDSLKKIRDKQG